MYESYKAEALPENPEMPQHDPQDNEYQNRPATAPASAQLLGAVTSREAT
jgi:hypothetical protein